MTDSTRELPKQYAPVDHEAKLYDAWEAAGVFKPRAQTDNETTFSVLMPLPNANGSLHVGHAVGTTLQDLMTRYHRMRGEAAVWFPGLDHAGFETQVVFEKYLEKQGSSRFQMERQAFYDATHAFVEEHKGNILQGFRRLGASADWDRLFYTLDSDIVTQVYDTFVALHEDGLVYRASRPVHWCVKHQTTLSDLETKDDERTEPLYYLKYGPLVVATGRPETIFADVAVAVHPEDERYQHLIGTEIEVDFGIETRSVKVVADEMVDPAFGTGAVKITPQHDANDFAVAERHGLPMDRLAIDAFGKLTELAGEFQGLKVDEGRKAVAELLAKKGLIDRIDEGYRHAVKVCYKCARTIEPRVLPQWFVAMTKTGAKTGKNLAGDAIKAVEDGRTKFVTERFRKTFDHWMGNIRDWNVSRQIVWGIQLPVWYCAAEGSSCPPIIQNPLTAGEPTDCPHCHAQVTRDTDVFDTWFSSGQTPVAVTRRERFVGDATRFYPTAVMETGWDIIFFWVARMLMFGLYLTDEVPFRDVYLHGMVRDADRKKMSKSKGNVIDPLAVIDQYGTDALRMALVFGTAAGNDMPMGDDKIRGMRNFANKLWNIARFVQLQLGDGEVGEPTPTTDSDRAILAKLDTAVTDVTRHIDAYRFHEAAQAAYQFVWSELADVYVEAAKGQLADEATAATTRTILLHTLTTSLKLLHPVMPFVTEAIWQSLPASAKDAPFIATASWPKAEAK